MIRPLLVLWVAVTLVFFALRVLPGDAVLTTHRHSSPQQLETIRAELGLTQPLPVQYGRYLWQLVQGDLGISLTSYQPVSKVIAARLVPTLALGLSAFGVATTLGMLLGVTSSLGGWLGRLADVIILVSQAVPFYITAIVAVLIFSVELQWLPASGSSRPVHLILPAAILGFHTSGSIARVLSANLRQAYQQPYMLTAQAKGLPPIDLFDHAFRMALLPTLSVLALQAGFLLSSTVIVEVMFSRRGVGSLLYQSVLDRDYPVVQALTLLGASTYLAANSVSQLARRQLDPRL